MEESRPLSGRQAEAARNDERILKAARAVFIENPASPISEVARRAGVGIGAVYRRFDSKEDLLRQLCSDGLDSFIEAVEAGLDDDRDAWIVFSAFMGRLVDADMHSLTLRLAGTFPSTEELYLKASRGHELHVELFERIRAAGVIRDDLEVDDIPILLEQIAAVRLGDERRTSALRHRYLTLILDGLRPGATTPLPASGPTGEEMRARWRLDSPAETHSPPARAPRRASLARAGAQARSRRP